MHRQATVCLILITIIFEISLNIKIDISLISIKLKLFFIVNLIRLKCMLLRTNVRRQKHENSSNLLEKLSRNMIKSERLSNETGNYFWISLKKSPGLQK